MICFKCSSEEFEVREANIRQQFRGDDLEIPSHVSICKSCGWQTLSAGQSDGLRKLTADAYRLKHNLLTSADIVYRRTLRVMSQQDFADFIGVGVASIKRWEGAFVQEPIYDKLMREKCDFNPFQYVVAGAAFSVSEGMVIAQGSCSIKTVLIGTGLNYHSLPIIIRTNFSNFTSQFNHLTGDADLASVSKAWRKSHKSCDCDVIS